MPYEHLSLRDEGDFAVLTMRRPERRNALSEAHLRELQDALGHVARSRARGLVLAAEGPVFSAGHDFADMQGRDLESMRSLLFVCSGVMQALQALPQPAIAQVEGLATAAGCQLVAACDLAVAGESARFQAPGGRGGWFCTTPGVALARAVGRKRALEMLLLGDKFDTAAAERMGLTSAVVPAAELDATVAAWAARLAAKSPVVVKLGKHALATMEDMSFEQALEYLNTMLFVNTQTEDAMEGIMAFFQKRAPEWKGR